ncbi:MAG: PEGA domain-containing protein, partial [Candidatus Marinimicrobia bacterium]|nr:PEGA domain-containing protein [Candidatus Neomarinimicrobiota bacterium]
IDGAFSGENPNNTVSLSLPMGDHSIKFTSQGFLDYMKTISIIPDESISYTVDMEKGSSGIVSQITTGIVVIRSEPQGAKVFLDGREIGNTPVQIPKAGAGKHILTVSKQLYHDHREEINVEADGIVQVMASLIPSFGALTVTSEPADAVVKLNDQIMGRTPLSLNQLASGDYTLNLSKDLYHDYEEKFIITDGSENNKPIKLHPAFGRLRVTGYPENAKVFINGQLRGNAPLDLPEMPSGTYSLRIEEELYATEEMQVTVEDGMTESAGFQLPPRFGTLNISGSPVGAQVFLNNKAIGELPINKLKIEAGLVEIKVSAKDYHEKILFQQINVGENVNVEVELRPHTGTLVVMTTPPGARVSLNDKQYGESPQIIKELRIGTYQLAVTHPDYLDIHENFNLALNQRKEFNFPLITYSGSIQQQIDQRRKYQLMNIAGSAIIGLIAGGLELYSQSLWKDYEIAMDTEEVERLFEQSNTFHKNAGIVSAVAMLSLSPTVYFQFDIHKLAGKLK